MHRTDTCNYAINDNFQALEMPYSGKQLSMVMLLPFLSRNRQLPPLENVLSNALVKTLLEKLAPAEVTIDIPKFSFALGPKSLKQQLIDLGMQRAFTEQANFSGITSTLPLKIGYVVHDAFIAVDEKGTTVMAATIGGAVSTGIPEISFNADHPFIFLIKDNPTNQILFIGYVAEPTAAEE
jgi:serpin B